MSRGENRLIDIFNAEGVHFIREKTFDDLRGGVLRFDFYLPDVDGAGVIVEYDGEQHFQQVRLFHKTRSAFLKAQENDRRKNSFCLANNIRLYRVPYWELDSIKSMKDILDNKFLVKTRWHNDNLIQKNVP